MTQTAPWPADLADLIDRLRYKAGWDFRLESIDRGQMSFGFTLIVTIDTPNSYNEAERRRVAHFMPVPPAAFDRRSWQRWLLEQVLLVERHEACEFFRLAGDDPRGSWDRPYAPSHGPGNDPYMVREVGTEADVRTSFRGETNPA